MRAVRNAVVLCFALMMSTAATARDTPVTVGDAAPPVTLQGLGGESVDLDVVYDKGTTVLVMLRGYPGYQCPLCSRQVAQYRAKATEFADAGVAVVLVYPGGDPSLLRYAREFLNEQPLPAPITMVLDQDYELTKAYGLRWDAPNETAYPSTFVVSQGGEIVWAKVSKTHGGRVSAGEAFTHATE